ncbi:MAG: arylesterase [Burkholderiales bacterium]
MNDGDELGLRSRRRWLAHCTARALVFTFALGAAFSAPALAQAPRKAGGPLILVVGDSLSAEYGLKRGSGWVALMQARLTEKKIAATVVNASISGDTTSGGRTRLPTLLAQRPDIVVLELGANDALRGLPLAMTRDNLDAMAKAAKASGAKVVIAGMQLPPNYGRQYGAEFSGLFATVAKAEGAALVPFLLKGVADVPQAESLFQADRIHPIAAAHPTILDNVWAVIEPLLKR